MKPTGTLLVVAALCGVAPIWEPAATAQAPRAMTIRVAESSGIRRTEFPVRAKLTVPRGTVTDAARIQLRLADAAVPAQATVVEKWPDGSVQTLDVDFNVSLAPGETRNYQVSFGTEPAAGQPARGLAVTEAADSIQIGNVKFSPSGSPLLGSAAYVRSEFIGQFPQARNGFAIVDRNGARHDFAAALSLKTEVIKRGPLLAALQYTGTVPIDASSAVGVTLLIEMPNSKSWVKMTAAVSDPSRRVRDLDFDTPLAFGAFPWIWDFGTENGTYGAFRTANDTVVFTQVVPAPGASGDGGTAWKVETGTPADLRPYESSASPSAGSTAGPGRLAFGWGHLQGAATGVAFGIDGFGQTPGTFVVSLNGQGQATYRFSPAATATNHRFGVYQHFVSTPIPIGAATTPTSMLHPPVVTVLPN